MYQKKHKSQTELAAAFYETYKKRIYQIARYLSPDEDACSELVQETLCALLDHLDLLESLHPEQIEVYIARTMHNIKIMHIGGLRNCLLSVSRKWTHKIYQGTWMNRWRI